MRQARPNPRLSSCGRGIGHGGTYPSSAAAVAVELQLRRSPSRSHRRLRIAMAGTDLEVRPHEDADDHGRARGDPGLPKAPSRRARLV